MFNMTGARTAESSNNQVEAEEKTAGGENRHDARVRHIIEGIVWVIGIIVLFSFAYFTRIHKGPWPGELTFSRSVQAIHYWPGVVPVLMFFSSLNDIPPSIAAMVVVVLFMAAMRWFKQTIFFALTVGVGNTINILIGDWVGRPRPSATLIHVDTKLLFNSFPSGHTEHDVVFYGFLLYLTFTKSVREWRYHWILLPFQVFAVAAILGIGYSRVFEGEHWISDVLGGYLSGVLWLFLFIFLYRWVTNKLAERRARKPLLAPSKP